MILVSQGTRIRKIANNPVTDSRYVKMILACIDKQAKECHRVHSRGDASYC